jgi:hypothetical protein
MFTKMPLGIIALGIMLNVTYKPFDYFKPAKQEVNGTVILPPLVFPDPIIQNHLIFSRIESTV